jgi:hypothetical protein
MTNIDPSYPEAYGWLLPRHLSWLRAAGVPTTAIIEPEPIRIAHGFRAPADGRFEHFPSGPLWFVFAEHDDLIFWRPGTCETATWNGRSFALNERIIDNAATYALGHCLNIFQSPLDWLRAGRDGIVVINWDRTFDGLRNAPRIAVDKALESTLRHHLQPPRLPEIFVLCERKEAVT